MAVIKEKVVKRMNLIDLLEIASLKVGKDALDIMKDITIDERVDKDLLAQQIVIKCGALCPVYNTSWSYMEWHKHWFEYNAKVIKELIDTTEYEYTPIESYSRYEDLKHNAKSETGLDESSGTTRNDTRKDNYEKGNSETTGTNSTVENQVSAFNDSSYQPSNRTTENGSINVSGKDTHSETETNDTSESSTRKYSRDNQFDSTDDNYVHGNNGLFTVQHLIEEQRKLVDFNVIDWIVNKYMKEGFLLVY